MRGRWELAAIVGVLVLAGARPVSAQQPDPIERLIGQPIAAVRFEIDGRPDTTGALVSLVDVKAGDPLRPAAIRTSVQRLSSVGSFDDVSVVADDEAGGGVGVRFVLSARRPVDSLSFTEDTGLDPKELQKRVRDQYGGLPTNVPPGKLAQSVREILNDEGYLRADVSVSTTKRSNPDRATLVFAVAAGDRALITQVNVNNGAASVFSSEQLRQRTGIMAGRPYRLGDINIALAAIRDELQVKRYYAAVASIESVVSPDLKSVMVTLTVDAGPRVKINWTGDPPPPGREEDLVPIARERAADDDLLDDSRVRVEEALKADGHVNARVTMTKDTSTPGVLIVTYNVTRGPRFRIDHLVIPAGLHMTTPTLEALLPIKPGDVYSSAKIEGALGAIRSEYHRRGFYQMQARADRETLPRSSEDGEVWVAVPLQITEGPQAVVTAMQFVRDTTQIPEPALRSRMRSREHEPYIQGLMIADRDAISAFYLDRGFRVAAVGIKPIFSADGQQVTLSVEISEGPQITVADIQVIGNTSVSASTILEEMTLKVGDPFGEEARLESQQRVNALGLFRRATVDEAPRLPGETKTHVIVTVEEAPARTISAGGGVDAGRLTRTTDDGSQEDYVAVSPRAFIAFQRRNLFGRNTSIDLFARAALKPTSDPSNPARDGHGFGFIEYRTLAAYHERRFLGTNADLQISGQVEQGLRPTFNFKHASATAEALRKLRPRLLVSARYSLDFSDVFNARIPPDQQLVIDRLFSQVRLSIVSTSLVSDRRNDPVAPSHGTYATADLEVAGRAIGSEIGYAKTFLQGSLFQSLTKSRRFVFAGRAELGLAQGFARLATVTDANGQPVLGPDGNPVVVKVDDLPASQRFFAGGSTTVRGFQLDRLGVSEVLDDAGLSNGGNGLVIFNAEVRALVGKLFGRNFGVAGFTDVGNIFKNAADVDLSRLRGTGGFGLRYDSPIGPIRTDFGYKFTRELYRNGSRERGWEFHFNLGEAF